MKKRMMSLIFELFKDSKRSDREMAKVLGVSQPTVTRMRHKLVKEGIIKEFTIIPDFAKTGYKIMAISCIRLKTMDVAQEMKKAEKWWNKFPNVIFVSKVQGMGMTGIAISLHKSYGDYSDFVAENLREWGKDLEKHDSMLINLMKKPVKPLSLKYLGEDNEA